MAESEVINDFIALFEYKKQGHLDKYVYCFRPELYDKVADEKSYYPFHLESDIIKTESEEILKDINKVSLVAEIGPGSSNPILNKTIPFLTALKKKNPLAGYSAIDITDSYAQHACNLVSANFNIPTQPICLDLLSHNTFNCIKNIKIDSSRTLYFSFGGTIFSNNSDEQIDTILKNVSSSLNTYDYLIFGVDISDNEEGLSLAYDTNLSYELALNTMHHLKEYASISEFNSNAFTPYYHWNKHESCVEIGLKSVSQQKFFLADKIISIDIGSEYIVYVSRKYNIRDIVRTLKSYNFKARKIVIKSNLSKNSYAILCAEKT